MTFLTRAAKYFLSLCVLSAVLIALLYTLGMAAGTPSDLMHILFRTTQGWIFIGAVALLSLLYPRIGFMKTLVAGSVDTHREQIAEAFRTEEFVPTAETDGITTFRATGIGRKLLLRFDDRVTVRQQGSWIELDGPRKVVARIQYRLESFIRRDHE